MLEVIVSAIILALVMLGLANVFGASKKFIKGARFRISAGELGKRFLDPFQSYVRQNTWGGQNCFNNNSDINPADTSNCPNVLTTYTVGSVTYTPQYFISNVGDEIKKVRVRIQLPPE